MPTGRKPSPILNSEKIRVLWDMEPDVSGKEHYQKRAGASR
jgi:hypothetical protein